MNTSSDNTETLIIFLARCIKILGICIMVAFLLQFVSKKISGNEKYNINAKTEIVSNNNGTLNL